MKVVQGLGLLLGLVVLVLTVVVMPAGWGWGLWGGVAADCAQSVALATSFVVATAGGFIGYAPVD